MGYTPQKFIDFETVLKAEHFKNIETAILDLEKRATDLEQGAGATNTDTFKQVGNPIDISILKGKTIVCFGDSITAGTTLGDPTTERPADSNGQIYPAITDEELAASIPQGVRGKSYPYYLTQICSGVSVDNLGSSGWCLPTGYKLPSKSNGYNAKGDSTAVKCIHTLKSNYSEDPYAIFVMFGVNEFTRHYPLGSESDLYENYVQDKLSSYNLTYIRWRQSDNTYVDGDENIVATYNDVTKKYDGITESCIDDSQKKIYVLTDTIYGAWEYAALRLKKDFTQSKIVFMTPYLFRGTYTIDGHRNYISNKNLAGYYFSDMMDVIIATGLKYKIPVLDNFYHGGVTLDNAWQYMGDGCHLNYRGGIAIAKNILEFLLLNPIVLNPKWLAPGGIAKFNPPSSSSDSDMTIHITDIALDKQSLDLKVGESYRLTATISPENASNRLITWSSSDNTVATVSSTGLVEAVSGGVATISCLTDDSGMTSTCDIYVTV